MEHQILLKSFEYSILHSDSAASGLGLSLREKNRLPANIPLVNVKIDFEQGHFFLEGNWRFMMASNRNVRQSWLAQQRDRVRVKTEISPCLTVDLAADHEQEAFHYTMVGAIQDHNSRSSCSGLLTLEKAPMEGSSGGEWMLTFYLYDVSENGCEIKFNLPIYPDSEKEELN